MDQRKLLDNANTITDMAKVILNLILIKNFFNKSNFRRKIPFTKSCLI